MDIFLAGSPVSLVVPLQDRNGNTVEASAVEYRVVKQGGEELLARTALAGFAGDSEVTIEIPAALNELPVIDQDTLALRETRTVELFLTVTGGTIVISSSYVLERPDPLVVGLNSFQSLADAEMNALDIPGLNGWLAATERDKLAALVDARSRIAQLRFASLDWSQDSLQYGTTGRVTAGPFAFEGDLNDLKPAEFGRLTERFRLALCRAQVAEADALLGGDPVDVRRQEGLMLESIGEVKQMFRPGKPLDLPISKRALRYLSPYISFAKRIGRG